MNSNYENVDPESVESAMMKRIQSRQMEISVHQPNQGYAVEFNPNDFPNDQYNPEVDVLKDQVTEMQQTIEVQHKLLKKLAGKQGYRIN